MNSSFMKMYSSASEFVYNTYGTFHTDKQTQTDDYQSFMPLDSESIKSINIKNNDKYFFKHLNFANQSYCQHFKDSFSYSYQSFKASLCFLIHAFWPDIFTQSGSQCVHNLSDTIKDKYNKRIEELYNENINT